MHCGDENRKSYIDNIAFERYKVVFPRKPCLALQPTPSVANNTESKTYLHFILRNNFTRRCMFCCINSWLNWTVLNKCHLWITVCFDQSLSMLTIAYLSQSRTCAFVQAFYWLTESLKYSYKAYMAWYFFLVLFDRKQNSKCVLKCSLLTPWKVCDMRTGNFLKVKRNVSADDEGEDQGDTNPERSWNRWRIEGNAELECLLAIDWHLPANASEYHQCHT